MATLVPNTNISLVTFLGNLIGMLNTNFQALNVALGERVVGQRLTVNGYVATGATTSRLTIGALSPPGSTPWAVILVRARESRDPSKDLTVATRLNFAQTQDGGSMILSVFEPSGLTQYTSYDLGFLVIFD
jgi:hypothetical protein